MSAVEKAPDVDQVTGHDTEDTERYETALHEPVQLEVRRNAVLSALLGAAASAVAIAYLWRAAGSGQALDWVLCAALGLLGAVFLHSLLDARTPLLVADELGVRIRLGATWRGLPWEGIERVVVRPRRGLVRDGSLVVQLNNVARAIEGLEGRARRHAVLNRKAYGGALAVPLGLSTRYDGSDDDLSDRIAMLSQGRAEVVTLLPAPKPEPAERVADEGEAPHEASTDAPKGDVAEPAETLAGAEGSPQRTSTPSAEHDLLVELGEHDALLEGGADGVDVEDSDEALEEKPRVRRRWLRRGTQPHDPRADQPDADSSDGETDPVGLSEVPLHPDVAVPAQAHPVEGRAIPLRGQPAEPAVTIRVDDGSRHTRTSGAVSSMREAVNPVGRSDSRVRAIAKLGDPVAPLVIDDFQPEPAYDPAIGPELAAARTRVGLSVDELAERTRIRPHVIESIEVDDFAPCGGDFYARGHIRTLTRVLGKDPVPLLEIYEARYAHAPVNARRVFEAELATGMGGQMARPYGGPNWTGLVAAVLVLVLVWAAVRLFAGDGGEMLEEPPPVLDGSAGLSSYYGEPATPAGSRPVTAVLTAVDGGTALEVRDADNNLVFDGEVALGEVKRLRVVPPVTVTADDGGAVSVRVGAQDHGVLGAQDSPSTQTFEAAQ